MPQITLTGKLEGLTKEGRKYLAYINGLPEGDNGNHGAYTYISLSLTEDQAAGLRVGRTITLTLEQKN